MDVDDGVLRIVFDVAVHSMDFGSGFLDDEEVAALRELARKLGVDPMEATPSNFQCRYAGRHLQFTVFTEAPYIKHPVDGLPCNGYRRSGDFPDSEQQFLVRMPNHDLAQLPLRVVAARCFACGASFEPLQPVSALCVSRGGPCGI